MDFYAKQLKTPETFREVIHGYATMSYFYSFTNNAQKAKLYANKVFMLSKTSNRHYNSEIFQYSLYKIDSINGNYLGALEHYRNVKKLSDSTHGVSKTKQIDELKIQYETLKKEENIQNLEVKSKLQQSKLDKSNLLINFSIGIILLLFVIIGLFYNHYQLKQKNNKK